MSIKICGTCKKVVASDISDGLPSPGDDVKIVKNCFLCNLGDSESSETKVQSSDSNESSEPSNPPSSSSSKQKHSHSTHGSTEQKPSESSHQQPKNPQGSPSTSSQTNPSSHDASTGRKESDKERPPRTLQTPEEQAGTNQPSPPTEETGQISGQESSIEQSKNKNLKSTPESANESRSTIETFQRASEPESVSELEDKPSTSSSKSGDPALEDKEGNPGLLNAEPDDRIWVIDRDEDFIARLERKLELEGYIIEHREDSDQILKDLKNGQEPALTVVNPKLLEDHEIPFLKQLKTGKLDDTIPMISIYNSDEFDHERSRIINASNKVIEKPIEMENIVPTLRSLMQLSVR